MNRWLDRQGGRCHSASGPTPLENYRFNEYADALYQFTWGTFCDWYLEFAKPMLLVGDPEKQAETRSTAGWALDQLLCLLHPVIPFVTEELFQQMADRGGGSAD